MTRVEPFGKVAERFNSQQHPLSNFLLSPPFQSLTRPNSNSSEPGIELAFLELEAKRNSHYTVRGYTRWDRWFIKSLSTSILLEWFPKRFARKCFRGQPMESEMATFQQTSLLSGLNLSS
ncbi:hypothetical protein AVEN_15486-1 [Araneus ventricosus]|uniref:Uncharacterized protein n=1 Tax=Araneus ventricosus TaxID=182803 RepID=A0A4Y2IHA2_ARAVE|nr:hypothetical protein AVEN_15486-1 [Araneus ventricosus]